MSGKSAGIEPPTFVGQNKLYETYKEDLKMWSRTISIEKELQAEVVVYTMDGHSSGIKEKFQVGIGDKLEGNEQGVKKFINFLDSIYLKD